MSHDEEGERGLGNVNDVGADINATQAHEWAKPGNVATCLHSIVQEAFLW